MRTFLMVVLGLLVAVVGISFALPDRWQVERSLHVDASPEVLRPLVHDLRRWPEWLPWGEKDDPSLQRTFTGDGVGQRMTWRGDEIGSGETTLTARSADEVRYSSSVAGGRAAYDGWVRIRAEGTGSIVTWGEGGSFSNPLLRWFATSFEEANGGDYERGLLNLQKLATGAVKRPYPGTEGTNPAELVPLGVDAGTP